MPAKQVEQKIISIIERDQYNQISKDDMDVIWREAVNPDNEDEYDKCQIILDLQDAGYDISYYED